MAGPKNGTAPVRGNAPKAQFETTIQDHLYRHIDEFGQVYIDIPGVRTNRAWSVEDQTTSRLVTELEALLAKLGPWR